MTLVMNYFLQWRRREGVHIGELKRRWDTGWREENKEREEKRREGERRIMQDLGQDEKIGGET